MDLSISTLYKQYTELCDDGGVEFGAFNIDPGFTNCVDGLIVFDLHELKEGRRQRHIDSH